MEPQGYDYAPSVFGAAENSSPQAEASRGQRLLSFIVDGAACLLLFFPVGYLLSAVFHRFGADIFGVMARPLASPIAAVVILFLIAGVYYLVLESSTRGRSLGKWITGTVAVREDDAPITSRDVIARSLLRLIPFEPFTALAGRPWHDRFSKTRVVRFRKKFVREATLLPDSSANYDVKS